MNTLEEDRSIQNAVRCGCVLLLGLYLTGCSSTPSGPPASTSVAASPTNVYENIHTVIRQIHLEHGNQKKVRAWNPLSNTAVGISSTQSIKLGDPIKSGLEVDALAYARIANDRSRYSDKSSARQREDLNREAIAAKRAMNESLLVPIVETDPSLFGIDKELTDIEDILGTYCREHQTGNLIRIPLNGGPDDPSLSKPLAVSSAARSSQIRLVCISKQNGASRSPFIVDLYYDIKLNRRLRVHFTATVLNPDVEQAMMKEVEGILP